MKQTFTDITINGEAISPELIATEAQNHPAPKGKPGMAWMAAARALAVKALILQEARRRNLAAAPMELAPGLWETQEDAIIRQVLDEAVAPPMRPIRNGIVRPRSMKRRISCSPPGPMMWLRARWRRTRPTPSSPR